MNNHPNRRKSKDNPYVLKVKGQKYFISFKDVNKKIHIIEIKKFKSNSLEPDLNCWLKFFTMNEKDDKEAIMSELVKEKTIMEEVQIKYNNFIKDRLMMNEYDKRQAYLYGNQIMLEEERRLGKEEGIKENQIAIAKNMKNDKVDLNTISKYTGLSIEEIKKL